MTNGAQLGSAVMFVQQLDRSVSFYQDVLALQVADQSPTAALLISPWLFENLSLYARKLWVRH